MPPTVRYSARPRSGPGTDRSSILGLTDLFRHLRPEERKFSWWDYRGGAFHRGLGLRIDLLLGAPAVAARVRRVEIDRELAPGRRGDLSAAPGTSADCLSSVSTSPTLPSIPSGSSVATSGVVRVTRRCGDPGQLDEPAHEVTSGLPPERLLAPTDEPAARMTVVIGDRCRARTAGQ